MKNVLILITAILLAGSAQAGEATKYSTAQGYTHVMCDNETIGGATRTPCGGSDDTYAIVEAYDTLTFLIEDPGNDNCEIYGVGRLDSNGDARVPVADLSGWSTDNLASTTLSSSNARITLTNTDFWLVWISCIDTDGDPGNADLTVEMRGSLKPKTR